MTRIVAGVSPVEPRGEVVAWAGREADLRHAVLELVSACPLRGRAGPAETTDGLRWAETLAAASRPGLPVASRVVNGAPEQALRAEAVGAELLVVGGDDQSPFREAIVGSVPGALLTTAPCPMVVVPKGAEVDTGADAPVLVGVDTAQTSSAALDYGFAAASRSRRGLHVVLCWTAPRERAERRAEHAEQRRALAVSLAGFGALYPDVAVAELLVDGDPVEELTRRSRRAALLVLGSRGRGRLASMAFGSVSRTLIRNSRCPVAVIGSQVPAASVPQPLGERRT
jgi:nucleotide-binding universal stress UspA family protein